MEAYAIYARDNGYSYLVAWRPWLHVASSIRKAYKEEAADATPGEHFSTRMSNLRSRLVFQIFGEDGLDRIGTALTIYNSALRTAEHNGVLADSFRQLCLTCLKELTKMNIYLINLAP